MEKSKSAVTYFTVKDQLPILFNPVNWANSDFHSSNGQHLS